MHEHGLTYLEFPWPQVMAAANKLNGEAGATPRAGGVSATPRATGATPRKAVPKKK
jgi:hypothetical protein